MLPNFSRTRSGPFRVGDCFNRNTKPFFNIQFKSDIVTVLLCHGNVHYADGAVGITIKRDLGRNGGCDSAGKPDYNHPPRLHYLDPSVELLIKSEALASAILLPQTPRISSSDEIDMLRFLSTRRKR